MTLYRGSQKIEDLYMGSTKIGELYKGSILVYKSCKYNPDQVIFESATPGTYSLDLLETGKYEVYCIAGGAGADNYFVGGGSGSGFIGIIQITKGNITVVCGAGGGQSQQGGNSSIGGHVIAYGGYTLYGGAIPTVSATIISTTLNRAGNNGGKDGGGGAVYGSYGGGGYRGPGTSGYIKIIYKGR